MMKFGFAAAGLAAVAAAAPAFAAQDAAPREQRVAVFGDDPCPVASNAEEIVVCGRLPEGERYRIPRSLRDRGERRPGGTSWAARVEDLEDAQRDTRPNSCSVVGTGGQSGCAAALARQWYRERRSR